MSLTTTDGVQTMSSLDMVSLINASRKEFNVELRHDHLLAKVPKVLAVALAPKFSGTNTYLNGMGGTQSRTIYNFPKREAMLMAMSYNNEPAKVVLKVCDKANSVYGGGN